MARNVRALRKHLCLLKLRSNFTVGLYAEKMKKRDMKVLLAKTQNSAKTFVPIAKLLAKWDSH